MGKRTKGRGKRRKRRAAITRRDPEAKRARREAAEEERIHPGDLVVCVGFGGGLTWGAAAIRWTHPQPVPIPRLRLIMHRLRYPLAALRSWLRRLRRRLVALWTRDILSNGSRKDKS